MTTEQIKELQQGIGTAAWKLNLDRFAVATGWDAEHGYTQDQFRALSSLSKALSRFDPETLLTLIEAGKSN